MNVAGVAEGGEHGAIGSFLGERGGRGEKHAGEEECERESANYLHEERLFRGSTKV